MKRTLLFLLICTGYASASQTWFVRTDGGTRYSTNVTTGQCDGLADVAYPGSGANRHCAFNDVRYLWSDNSAAAPAWVISGGDTAIIRGCHALGSQLNPDNPHCRIGYDNATNGSAPNLWCGYGNPNATCYNPPIPAGTSGNHTRILGQNYASCNTGTNPRGYQSNLTQLFGGFALGYVLNLQNTSYVDIQCLDITAHNGACVIHGTPAYPAGCSTGTPYSDYANNGIITNNATSNILLQDVSLHGFTSDGLFGPIGGPITMTRVFVGFNAFAGWNFDDGSSTPDAAGSSITANHVIMEANGFLEEYPIVDPFPAVVGYDDSSQGFGDSWSGQNTTLDAMYCNDCEMLYNTKDGFIGPHTWISSLTIINSISAFNMGQQWKWGGLSVPNNTVFENNLTVSGCQRMSTALPGAPSNYNQYLSDFCRAAGNTIASDIPAGSTWNFANNTFIFNSPTLLDIDCPVGVTNCTSTVNWTNNIVLGYQNIPTVFRPAVPAIFYNKAPAYITINTSHNIEYGSRNGACSICSDPLFVGEPAQAVTAQSALDVFNTAGNGFRPTAASPAIGAGMVISGLTTDYYGAVRPNPPGIGAVEFFATGGAVISGNVVLSGVVQ